MINVARIRTDLEALARFGSVGQGIDRPSFSPVYRQAVDWLADQLRSAGMTVREDTVGNLIGRMGPESGPAIVSGSHIDTVPNGGKYDGALGVLAALEVARSLKEHSQPLGKAFEVIAFVDEEGAYLGELGCRAMIGDLTFPELDESRGRDNKSPVDAMRDYGLHAKQVSNAARPHTDFAAYVELHIEQGPVLENAQIDIGVVSGIVGLQVSEITFAGEANHAGTTPLPLRKDALRAAAAMITESFARLERDFSTRDHRLTYGAVEVSPGASNVVPASAKLTQEIRADNESDIDALHAMTLEVASKTAAEYGVDFDMRTLARDASAAMSTDLMDLIEGHAGEAGFSLIRMASGAGHDAQIMANVTDTGMIFIPSVGGISHNPAEHSSDEQIERGATVLYRVIADLLTR